MEEGSCNTDSLLFAAGECVSQFSDFCVISFWKGHDEFMDGSFFCGLHDLLTGCAWFCNGDIVCDGIVEQVGFLCHIAFQITEPACRNLFYISAIYENAACTYIPKTHQKL